MKIFLNSLIKTLSSFLIFFLLLIITISILTNLRTSLFDFQFADSKVVINEITNTSILDSIKHTFLSVITLEFGLTLSGEKVSEHILKRLEPTFILAVFSVMFGGGFGVFFALYSVYSKSKFIEIIFHTFSRFILSIPIFVIGVSCFLLFSIFISIFPPGGYERGNILFLVLPGFSLGSRVFARIYFFAFESSKIEESSTYIFHLRARGFGERKIVFKYIFYKIFPILLILLLIDLGSLLSGAMIVEEIFSFPGIGKSTYFAIKNMDANLLSALLFYSGLLFYTLNSLAKYLQSKISGAASS